MSACGIDMHSFLRSLPMSLQTAVHDAPVDKDGQKGVVREKVTVLDTCTFNPQTHTIRIQVAPSRLARRLDIAEQFGQNTFLLCLDVSGSMVNHAAEMVRVLQQIEGELMQLQSFVRIRLLFFSGELLDETLLGELASVCKKSGWLGGTEFGPPLHECLKEVKANPKDTKDHADGVWSLPPNYRSGDKDRAKYEAIGESDRFLLKFARV